MKWCLVRIATHKKQDGAEVDYFYSYPISNYGWWILKHPMIFYVEWKWLITQKNVVCISMISICSHVKKVLNPIMLKKYHYLMILFISWKSLHQI